MALPGIDNPIVPSGRGECSRVTESEVLPYEPQDLYVSEASAPSGIREITARARRFIGVIFDDPSEVSALGVRSLVYQIELFHRSSTAQGRRSYTQILVIIISFDIPIAIFVSEQSSGIIVRIRIIIDELLSVLSVSLRVLPVQTSARSHRDPAPAHTVIEIITIARSAPIVPES